MIQEKNVDIGAIKDFLSGVKIFMDLDGKVITSMAENMNLYRFEKGELLIEKNKPGKYMLLISEGQVAVDLVHKKIALAKGDIVGEMSLLSGQLSSADVIAETVTKAFALHRYDFHRLMAEYAELASVMSSLMNSRISESK